MLHWLTRTNSRRSIALAMLFALLLTLAPAKVQAASDQNPDVIVAQATNDDKNEDGQLYRYYFGSVAKDNSDGSLTAAFYRNWDHAPDSLSEDMGVIICHKQICTEMQASMIHTAYTERRTLSATMLYGCTIP